MSKFMVLAFVATMGVANVIFRPIVANPPVELQSVTPGVSQSGHLNVSGTATVGLLRSQGTVFGQSSAPTGTAYGGFFTVASSGGRGFYGYASSPSGLTYGGFFQNASTSGRAVYGLATATSGFNYGGYFQSASNEGRGLLGVAASSSGTTYGVYGKAVSAAGYGVYSEGNMSASGVISGNGSGLSNVNALKLGGLSSTSFGRLSSTQTWTGSNTFSASIGVRGLSSSTSGAGLYGYATASSGTTYGLYAVASSPDGRAGFGYATRTTGRNYGLYGRSNSGDGRGVFGYASLTSGYAVGVKGDSDSPTGYGVAGIATRTSGTNYGVFGRTYSSAGFGVYSMGRFASTGTKSFRIDHPLNPGNEYLLHYSSEGPEPLNVYSGNVVTDLNGAAWVQLPDYFEEINKDFRYTLTVIDGSDSDEFVLAKVAVRIANNRFKIRTNQPRVQVSWRVEGVRNDAWVRTYGAPVEQQKDANERGKYQHPELYGLPPSKAVSAASETHVEGDDEVLTEPQSSNRK